jgi:phosphoglycolate phosphatase
MRNPKDAHWRGQRLAAVLFDLDGTLLDTAADIALALNRTMVEYECKPLAEDDVRRMVGRGSPILIERAVAAQDRIIDAATQAAMLERFFHHYGQLEESNEDTAQPYTGAAESLCTLHDAGLRTAVVTNKQHRFAGALSESLMVGDSVNDVQAARAAGIPIVCVSYGYNEGRDPRTLECDLLLDSLAELPALLLYPNA